jgi:hypothetical protein
MQSRNAAFAVLCRLALRDFIEIPRNPLRWSRPAARSFSNVAPRPFHHSARHYIDQQPTQTPPQEPRKEPTQESLQELPQGAFRTAHEARPPASPKKPSYAPNRPPSIPFEKQAYEMTFTCKPCSTRSTHRISKQGYHFGSVLITCPECKNRHIISDHLGVSCAYNTMRY